MFSTLLQHFEKSRLSGYPWIPSVLTDSGCGYWRKGGYGSGKPGNRRKRTAAGLLWVGGMIQGTVVNSAMRIDDTLKLGGMKLDKGYLTKH